jgi:hypothetical protein
MLAAAHASAGLLRGGGAGRRVRGAGGGARSAAGRRGSQRCRLTTVVAFAPSHAPAPSPPPVPALWTGGSPRRRPLPPALLPLGAALDAALDRYWSASPTARAVVDAMWRRRYGEPTTTQGDDDATATNATNTLLAPLHHDHLAFRTFALPGHGVAALGAALRTWGYVPCDEGGRLTFPRKKLRAAWFAPPPGLEGSLPRVFVSELAVDQLSERAQAAVRKYAGPAAGLAPPPPPSGLELRGAAAWGAGAAAGAGAGAGAGEGAAAVDAAAPTPTNPTNPPTNAAGRDERLSAAAARAWTCVLTGALPWLEPPSYQDWKLLADESEYAAWVLAHGYAVNHAALSVHRLRRREEARELQGVAAPPPAEDPRGERSSLAAFAEELRALGFALNDDGGAVVKASPGDNGLLLQCSTVADVVEYDFGGGGGGGGRGGAGAAGEAAAAAAAAADAAAAPNHRHLIPGAYLEFVERRPLPRFAQMPWRDLREWHRRDGFEQANADGIFASTTMALGGGGGGGGGSGGVGGAGAGVGRGKEEDRLIAAAALSADPAPAPRSLPKSQGAALGEGA